MQGITNLILPLTTKPGSKLAWWLRIGWVSTSQSEAELPRKGRAEYSELLPVSRKPILDPRMEDNLSSKDNY